MLQHYIDEQTGLRGFKDAAGQVAISPLYERAEDFEYGLAEVSLDGKTGMIDTAGKTVIEPAYSFFYRNADWIIGRKEKTFDLFRADGKCMLRINDVLEVQLPGADLIRIKQTSGWGVINLEGRVIIEPRYKSLGPLTYGRIAFFENERWGWLNREGNIVVEALFSLVGVWDEHIWWGLKDDSYILYDNEGNVVRNEGWLRIVPPGVRGAAVKTIDGWQHIDKDFNVLASYPPVYEWVEFFENGFAAVKRGGMWGAINEAGKEVIDPAYKHEFTFSEGVAAVRKGDLFGFIDVQGVVKIPFIYHSAGSFKDGKARVRQSYFEFFINRSGERVSDLVYLDD